MNIINVMKSVKGIWLFSLLAILVSAQGWSQNMSNPVKWKLNYKMISATEGEAIIIATISDGWHLYGTNLPKGGPKSMAFDFSTSEGVKFIGELSPSIPSKSYRDEMFGMTLSCWEKRVVFRRKFKITNKQNARIGVSVTFMSCNDVTCSAPATETLSKKIQ